MVGSNRTKMVAICGPGPNVAAILVPFSKTFCAETGALAAM